MMVKFSPQLKSTYRAPPTSGTLCGSFTMVPLNLLGKEELRTMSDNELLPFL